MSYTHLYAYLNGFYTIDFKYFDPIHFSEYTNQSIYITGGGKRVVGKEI